MDDGTIRVKFRIDTGIPGDEWQLFVSDDGERVFAGTRVAEADGVVRLTRRTRDRTGPDEISATGLDVLDGETCTGDLTV
jgi:hypothetical protein